MHHALVAEGTKTAAPGARPSERKPAWTWPRDALSLFGLALAFGAVTKLGLLFLAPPDNLSYFWPASGFLLAVLTLTPPRRWPLLLAVVFPAGVLLNVWGSGRGFWQSVGYAVADMLEAWPAALILLRVGGPRPGFSNLRSVLGLVVGAAPASAALSAGLGAAIATRLGTTNDYWTAFRTWAVSVLISDIVVTPFIVTWARGGPRGIRLREASEAALILLGLMATTLFVFGSPARGLPLIYLPFPLVLWATLRLGPRGASLASFTFATTSVLLVIRGVTPLVLVAPTTGLRVEWMQLLIGSLAVSSLSLAAAVAERQATSERMRDAEARQRLIIEAAPVGIALVDAEGTISLANAGYATIVGRPLSEIIDHRFNEFTHPDDREEGLGMLHDLVTGKRDGGSIEKRYVRPDGTVVQARLHVASLRDSVGRFLNVVAMVEDVSERKRLEAKLNESQRLEAMGKLAGGVAHDFNNLLTVILAQADLARRVRDGALGAALDDIADAARRGAGLTRQLLTFARSQIVEPKVLDLNAVLRDVMGLLRRLIAEDVEIRFEPAESLWPVRIDASQFEQIVVNLAVNARDAMPRGGKITITTASVTVGQNGCEEDPGVGPGQWALITLRDNGVGMDEETAQHAFEPFFTTKALGKGTGLGLATVHGVVTQCGGHVAVSSEVNRGTTFRVWLPRAFEAPEAAEAVPEAHVGGTETILVVEDDSAVRRVACDILRSRGYAVLAAADADAAVTMANEYDKDIQLLVTDVIMPNKSGKELAEALSRSRPEIRVLFVSGYTGERIAHHGVLEPGVAFLQKPYSPGELVDKVSSALHETRRVSAPSTPIAPDAQ